jgi:SWIM/SEC-C metal-binding protein
MSNRITDIGTMRSSVDADSRINSFGAKKTAKLGSEKNPAAVRVQSEARSKEVRETCEKHGWECRISVEPSEAEDISDLNKLLNPQKPTVAGKKVGRNEPCPCGSGKKFKNCCAK